MKNLVRERSTGELFAVKEIKKNADKEIIRTEIEITKKASSSPFAPKFYSIIETVTGY
jgi:hypothetical protein